MPITPLPDPSSIQPVEFVRTNDYSEGAVVDREGNLYFSHGKIITKVTPDGQATDWAETGAPNGHKILPNGEHIVCDGSHHAMLRLSAEGVLIGYAASGKSEDLAEEPVLGDGVYVYIRKQRSARDMLYCIHK